jgi:NAD(P)-dependent dehydrogenase (short-subunit alcohol dehydrogenase family)
MPLDPSTAVVVVLLPILLALLHSLFSFLLSRRRQLADRLGLLPRTALGVLLPMYECGLPATATCTDADTDVATVATAPRRWALVTGASRGLGRAFALALAADGWGVLCLDLDDDALDAVCAEVAASGPGGPLAATKLACDATDSAAATEACVRAVDALPRGASLRLLVNNVGISTPAPALLPQHSAVDVERLVSINFLFAAQLTRALWPRLAAVAGGCARSRSGILFVSSGASLIPAAFVSVYGATKAALNHLARALRAEAEAEAGAEVESGGGGGHRLDVLAVTPGYVAGAGNTPRWTGATTVGSSPEDVARVRPLICVLWVSMAVLRLRHGIGGHVSRARARVCVCVCVCVCEGCVGAYSMEKNDATECKPLFVCVSPLRVSGHDPPMLFIYGRIYLHDIVEEYKDLLDLADAHDAKRPAKRTVKHTSAIGREVYYVQTAL